MPTPAICRFCHATCGLMVTIEAGRVVRAIGDRDNPMYRGYSCVKGRNYHHFLADPQRVLQPLRRMGGGGHEPVALATALSEAGARLQGVLQRHGPRSVALYGGTFSHFCPAGAMLREAFMDAIGSPMRFSNATIDQPGKPIAMGLHGRWGAGPQGFADADVCMLVGANPLVSMWGGIPSFNPAMRLHEARARGLKLIVIDPRVTETARKADLHLQCLPGHDPQLLAAMLHVILEEGLEDRDFLRGATEGIEALRAAVAPFTPQRVAPPAGLEPGQIVAAARMFASARRGNVTSGTGPSMAPHGTLMDYLVLVLNSLCGRWIRAGEAVPNRGVLFRCHSGVARAEAARPAAQPPTALRVRGLHDTAAGLPTAALADEILTPGAGQVRALIVVGGNPLASWPNRARTLRALQALELLIVVDPQYSATAEHAHFVFGPRFGYETPALTFGNEGITAYGLSLGYPEPYAQYQPSLVEPPAGSAVLEDWRIFYELARTMRLSLSWRGKPIDMEQPPRTEELLERFVQRSRVPLEEVRRHPHGAIFADPEPLATAPPADWPHRLQLAAAPMLEELAVVAAALDRKAGAATSSATAAFASADELELLLVSRREHAVYNSAGHRVPALARRRAYNPAYLNPADAAHLGVRSGEMIRVASSAGCIDAVAETAADVRRGVISIAHGFPAGSSANRDPRSASTAELVDDASDCDPSSGLPRMSAIPVQVRRAVPPFHS